MRVTLFKTFVRDPFVCNSTLQNFIGPFLAFFVNTADDPSTRDTALEMTEYLIRFESRDVGATDVLHMHVQNLFTDLFVADFIFDEIRSPADTPSLLLIAYVRLAETVSCSATWLDTLNNSFEQVVQVYDVAIPADYDDVGLAMKALNTLISLYHEHKTNAALCGCCIKGNVARALSLLYRRWFYMMYRYPTLVNADDRLKLYMIERDHHFVVHGASRLPADLVHKTQINNLRWQNHHLFMTHERAIQWQHAIFAHRAITVCIGLHNLKLPALLLTMITEADQFAEAAPFHWQWLIVTTVKHWFDNK